MQVDAPDLFGPLYDVEVAPKLILLEVWTGTQRSNVYVAVIGCPRWVYISARGSGQNPQDLDFDGFGRGLGDRGTHFYSNLIEAMGVSSREFPAIAVDYPAVAVGLKNGGVQPGNLPAEYSRSVDDGVLAAGSAILKVLTHCQAAGTRLILFGYSQGAQVMGDAFSKLSLDQREGIGRVVLFSDATYNSQDPDISYQPTATTGHGIKGQRQLFMTNRKQVIESWCWSQDAICQGLSQWHFHGDIYDVYEKDAAIRAAPELLAMPKNDSGVEIAR